MNWRTYIPRPFRLAYRILSRLNTDKKSGLNRQLARRKRTQNTHDKPVISITQPIMPSAYYENKIHNMCLANSKINDILIMPGEVFSFWATVGYPGRLQGFRKGRNLIDGKVRGAYGGGLCQVSGILYYIALCAGLEIVERHNHSVDIYAENERFAPLGSDATVVYGYKDLRIRNISPHPISFFVLVNEHRLTAKLLCKETIVTHTPEFIRLDMENQRRINTTVNGKMVATSIYKVQ